MPPKNDWVTPKVEIREASNKGKGLFAIDLIKIGEDVVVWGGYFINTLDAQKAKEEGKLVMQFDEDLFSVEDRGESDAYFLNHSCDPNIWMKNAFTLEAMRDIEKGEELTADYAIWEMDENKVSKWECSCGSENCRHRVTGKDWKMEFLQEKYKDHFIPLLNKRIAEQKR